MKLFISCGLMFFAYVMTCCSSADNPSDVNTEIQEEETQETFGGLAEVVDVSVSRSDEQHTFSVTISSPDLGCKHYADWWEIIDLDGNLLYGRILDHSHVNEQPFTRTGAPITLDTNSMVYVRAHMNTTGYGDQVFKGSISDGFLSENLDVEFAKDLDKMAPLPGRCDF